VREPFEYLSGSRAHTIESLDGDLTSSGVDDGAVSASCCARSSRRRRSRSPSAIPARWLSCRAGPDPRHNRQWGLRAIRWFDAEPPRRAARHGRDLRHRVDDAHPDLRGVVASYDHDGATATDLVGHGTHVSGIVAARTDDIAGVVGVARCRVAMWKVFPDEPLQGTSTSTARASCRALERRRDVGRQGAQPLARRTQSSQAEQLLFDRLERAASRSWPRWGTSTTTATRSSIRRVRARPRRRRGRRDEPRVAVLQHRRPHRHRGAGIERPLDAADDGVALSSRHALRVLSGTSMATPHVAAAAALVAAHHPDWTPADTKEHLRNRATKVADMGGKSFTEEFGDGLLDIASLLASD
jgi:hypothetical protein